jgi:hypothetical protein
MYVLTLTSQIVLGVQLLPQTVNVWVDALLSRKMLEGISS